MQDTLLNALSHVWQQLPQDAIPNPSIESYICQQAEQYWQLLARWNAKIKLTGALSLEDFATRHLADSLFGLSLMGELADDAKILDVGAGAGFPGAPLALLYTDGQQTWDLAESHKRRCAFLGQLQRTLKLSQMRTHAVRIAGDPDGEGLNAPYDRILFRAVAPEQVLPLATQYLAPKGKILYWGTQAEIPTIPEGLSLEETFPYQLQSSESFAIYSIVRT